MTRSDAAERTQRLVANRKLVSAEKQERALRTIRILVQENRRVNFKTVERAASVSTWFVYNNIEVRAAIEEAMQDQRVPSSDPKNELVDDRTIRSLRIEIANAREEIKDLRTERVNLRQRLERKLGQQIEVASKQDLLGRIRQMEIENLQLKETAKAESNARQGYQKECELLKSELDGSQLALRQLLKQINREC